MTYAITYGPEVLNEHDDLDEAIALAHYESEIRDNVRLYVADRDRDVQVYSTEWPLPDDPRGYDEIISVDPHQPNAIVCGTCGRGWMRDVTPVGRCPWEILHPEEE